MKPKKSVFLYILATFIFSACLVMATNRMATAAQLMPIVIALAFITRFVPAIVALALIFIAKNRKAALAEAGFLQIGEIKWYELALFLPMVVIIGSYLIGSLLGFFKIELQLPWLLLTYRTVLLTLMWPLVWSLGQEIGWRGYLQPKLVALMGLHRGIACTGMLWALWYGVSVVVGIYFVNGEPIVSAFSTVLLTALLMVTFFFMSFPLGWIRHSSQSVWPCVIFHSTSIATLRLWAPQFKLQGLNGVYIAGEFGAINLIFWMLCTLWVFKKLKRA